MDEIILNTGLSYCLSKRLRNQLLELVVRLFNLLLNAKIFNQIHRCFVIGERRSASRLSNEKIWMIKNLRSS